MNQIQVSFSYILIFKSSRHGLFILFKYTSISIHPILLLQFPHVAIMFLICLNPPFFFEIIWAASKFLIVIESLLQILQILSVSEGNVHRKAPARNRGQAGHH